jgi:2-dehydropantoate 2-reductase
VKKNPTIVMVGAGAIGASVGGWIAQHYKDIHFLDVGKVAEALKSNGITMYLGEKPKKRTNVRVKVIEDISQVPSPDVIFIAVKTYSLDAVAKSIRKKTGDTPVIVALQNGVDNQEILPKYFSKVIYGVISYNAWLDEPGVVGYQKPGPLILGTVDNKLKDEMRTIAAIMKKGVETIITDHLQDAARSKMIVNLTNSLTTLIGHNFRKISDPDLFQKLLTNLTYEGVQIVKAAGYEECKLGGMPPWILMELSVKLPRFLTKGLFDKNVKKMVVSSMAQDVIQRGGSQSEIETLNGYFIKLADKHKIKAPYNRAIYELCKQEFAKPEFKPIDVKDVWKKVKEKL